MGTTYSIKLVGLPVALNEDQIRERVDAILEGVNERMSTYRDDSELSRFNQAGHTAWFGVSRELLDVLTEAQRVSDATEGAFDVTVGPLVDLWGFGPPRAQDDQIPAQRNIDGARARVGYQALALKDSPPSVRKFRPDIQVDLSAIAKGYAVDRLATYFDILGVGNYLIEIGGEIKARGLSAKQRPWRIAIERPSSGARSVQTVVELEDAGLATSGDYRNYFEPDGLRYSHAIDPLSGRPVTHRLASVTVVDSSVMRADAWATALLVLGPEKGLRLADEQGIAAYLIIAAGDDFETRATQAFAGYLPAAAE